MADFYICAEQQRLGRQPRGVVQAIARAGRGCQELSWGVEDAYRALMLWLRPLAGASWTLYLATEGLSFGTLRGTLFSRVISANFPLVCL